jgi:DNA-binding CsgD family transcriptional regulator
MPNSRPQKKRREKRKQAIVLATPEGKIQFADAPARRWLKQFFSRPVRAGLLPRKICRWLAEPQQKRSTGSFVAKRENVRLYLRKEKSRTPHSTLLLLELIKEKGEERSRWHRQLTRREHEVILWLRRGKSNAEIAAILGIKPSTVGKHLERIYPKLGVESRAAAISIDLESPSRTGARSTSIDTSHRDVATAF